MRKLLWAWRLLWTDTYVVLTDKAAVINVPSGDPDSYENIMLLAAQTAALQNFRFRLEDLVREHEEAVLLLTRRNEQKRTTRGTGVRKSPKKRSSKV
jgi:hypothetical protein